MSPRKRDSERAVEERERAWITIVMAIIALAVERDQEFELLPALQACNGLR